MSEETLDPADLQELEVVCAQCSFPMVQELNEEGETIGFRVESGPSNEEEAVAAGWTDHGLGLYCPKCSVAYLEDLARERAAEAGNYAGGGLSDMINGQIFRTFLPDVSSDTIDQFVRMFHSQRIAHLKAAAGLQPDPIYVPRPKDEAQAVEFLKVAELLPQLEQKLNPPKETA
jgi:hypothetical protein